MKKIRSFLRILEMIAFAGMLLLAAYLAFGLWTYFSPRSNVGLLLQTENFTR